LSGICLIQLLSHGAAAYVAVVLQPTLRQCSNVRWGALDLTGLSGTLVFFLSIVTARRIPIQPGFRWALDVVSSLFGC